MKTRKILWLNVLIFTFVSMIFMGCGGGSSSSPKEYTVGKGTYIDSAVSGISYICGKEKGVTDEDGQFSFEVGASCTFFIKDIELRKVAKDALHDKVVIFEDHPKVAQFLQTLDNDGDPSNGITVDPKVIELLGGTLPESEEELKALVTKIKEEAQADPTIGYTGRFVPKEEAVRHLETTREALDHTPPELTLQGTTPMSVHQNSTFVDPGVTVSDDYYAVSEITISTVGSVDTATPANYTLTYTATDGAGNHARIDRVVKVIDVTPPVLTLVGGTQTIELGASYVEQGATATDNTDGEINSRITIDTSAVNLQALGTYQVTYTVKDAANNTGTIARTVNVVDTTAPTLTLVGTSPVTLPVHGLYNEDSVNCSDNNLRSCRITVGGDEVKPDVVGQYVVRYNAVDASGNAATELTRIVNVIDNTIPVIQLNGANAITLMLNESYTEQGATCHDDYDTNCAVTLSGDTVNPAVVGNYLVRYNAVDSSGNVANEVTRAVRVIDKTPDAFHFTDVNDVNLSTYQQASVIINGISEATDMEVLNGEYSLDGGSSWESTITTVDNGTEVWVRHMSATTYSTPMSTTLIVGGVSDIFTSTTKAYVNQPPVAMIDNSETALQVTLYQGESLSKSAVGMDDLGVVSCQWSDNDGAVFYTKSITPPLKDTYDNCFLYVPSFPTVGNFIYTLTVEDTNGTTDSNEINVTVLGNEAPTVDIGANREIYQNDTLNITAVANDADGDTLTYQWLYGLNGNMVFAGDNLNFSESFPTLGLYTLKFTARDTHGVSTSKEINVSVIADNVAPVVTPNGDTNMTLFVGEIYTERNATVTDNVDHNLSAVIIGAVDTSNIGTYTLTYRAIDRAGNIGEATRVIHVLAPADTTPDAFNFIDKNQVTLSSVQTASMTVLGINREVNLSIIGGEYSLDNGATWSDVNVTVENNQIVMVRHTSSSTYATAVNTILTVGGISDTFTSTTRAEDVGGNTVIVGNLMWEDTSHVKPDIQANWVTYPEAVNYCSTLVLDGFNNWRLPHGYFDQNTGPFNDQNEFLTIRQQPRDLNGDVWFYQYDQATGENYDQIDSNSRSIIEPFNYIDQGGSGYWTDLETDGGYAGHINIIFSYGLDNMDAWSDDWNSSVRCVRMLQADDTPLMVEAGANQHVEVNHPITITGTATSTTNIVSYTWYYGSQVVGTTASFTYTPTTVNLQQLVLKVEDAAGTVAQDMMYLNVEAPNPLPVVDAGENKTVQLGESVTITGTASDNSAIAGYEWNEGASSLANTVSFTYTPSSIGIKTLTLTVTDDQGATASDTMEVNVTEVPDTVPDAFSFTDVNDVNLSQYQQASITVAGINTDAELSIVGGEYSLDGGTTWRDTTAMLSNATTVWVRHQSAADYNTETNTTLTIGGVSDTFTSTTKAFVDQAPVVMLFGSEEVSNQTIYVGENPYVDAMMSDDVGVKHCVWENDNGDVLGEEDIDPVEQYPYGRCVLQLPVFTTVGEFNYTLIATDTSNQVSSNTLHFTVLPNAVPTADIGGNRTISAGTMLNITAVVNDADGDDMQYQWMYGVKDSGIMTGVGSNLEFSQRFDTEGLYEVTFRVDDNHTASTTERIEVNVTAAVADMTAPVISILGENPLTILSGKGTYADEGAEAVDDIDGVIPVSTEDHVDGYKAGDYNVTYRAVDSSGNEAVAVRIVHVLPNLAIYLYNDAVISLDEGDDNELHFGIANDVASVAMINNPNFVNLVDHGDNTYHLDIAPTSSTTSGYYGMQIIAYDLSGDNNVTQDVHIYYDTAAPRLDIVGENDVEVNVNETVTIDFIAQNLDTIELNNSRIGEALPSFITLDTTHSKIVVHPTSAITIPEFYELKLIGLETTHGVQIERNLIVRVNPEGSNHKPVIHLANNYYLLATRNEVRPLSIEINATDSDGDDLTYEIQYYKGGLEVSPSYATLVGHTVTLSPEVNSSEELQLILHVEDNNSALSTKSLNVEIKDQLPDLKLNLSITDREFGTESAIDIASIIGIPMYEVEFNNCEEEISLVELNATAVAFKNPNTNAIVFSDTYSEQGDNTLAFANGMQVKYMGEVTDLSEINSFTEREIFKAGTTGIVAYEFVYAGQDDAGNPEFEHFLWLNEDGRTAFENYTQANACGGGGKGK